MSDDGRRDWLWYFAYGSNLDPRTFLGRRRMRPRSARVVRLYDHRLVFDLPIGPRERGVANLLPVEGEFVEGVVYEISARQAHHLDRTEGVPKAYRRLPVDLELHDGGRIVGFTYLCPRRAHGRKPSPRYMGLILRGARHHGLSQPYIDWLRDQELAVDERSTQGELFGPPRRSR